MTSTIRTALAVLALLWLAPLHAVPITSPTPAPETSEPEIAASIESGDDDRIAQRIRGIFAEIEGLENVGVDAQSGVVTLTGRVGPKNMDRAEAIAARVAGVVTVENRLERDLEVSRNLDPAIGGLEERFNSAVRAAPLVGVAILVALAIALLGYLIAGLGRFWQRVSPNAFLAEMIATAIRFGFIVLGIVIALDILGATALLGAVLGGAGVIGIALGFAMRDTIENYVASLMLSLRQPFRANDHVVIDNLEGVVIRLTSRATVLMTLDGNHLRIPNGTVFKAVILNYTRNPQRRFEFDLGIDAEDDPNAARHLGVEVLKSLDFVLDDPAPTARVEQVGDSNIVIKFLGWIDQEDTDWYKARSRAIPAVKDALEEAGFALPEPIYRLRFDTPPPGGVPSAAGAQIAQTAPVKPQPKPIDVPHDVAPETPISDMVMREREVAPEREKDLLDPKRPVE
ncbi:MAG: mechanosensitive ion channel [Novosphingobium sp.]|nr:mechanosensitive ion channel [Novosphingobium sp.]